MSSGSNASTQPSDNARVSGSTTQQTAPADNARQSHEPEGSPAPPNAPQAQVTTRCDAIVKDYRTGVNPSNWMSLPKSSECSPTSSMPGQGMMTTSTTPFASTLRCSTAMRMSNKFSTKKEKIKSEQESGMKWKQGDQDDLVLPTSLKRRMMERVGKMGTPSEGKNRTKEMTPMTGQDQQRDLGSTNRCSRGTLFERLAGHSSIPICNEPSSSSRTTPSTSKQRDEASPTLPNAQSSLKNNGLPFWQERPSILMPSSQQTILPPSTKSTLTRYLKGFLSNSRKACRALPSPRKSLATQMSGPQHGTHTHKPSSLLSCIGSGNSLSINNMCPLSSGPLQSPSIAACSSLTEPFEPSWKVPEYPPLRH